MATMTKVSSVREGRRVASEAIRDRHTAGVPEGAVSVLSPDGHTYSAFWSKRRNRLLWSRECGWMSRGMLVNPHDVPCVIG